MLPCCCRLVPRQPPRLSSTGTMPVDSVWPRAFWKRFLIALVGFLPLAVVGWVVAGMVVSHGASVAPAWTALFVPLAATGAALSSAALSRPGMPILRKRPGPSK